MAERVRVALYGGSFDPPHVGHVMAVAYALGRPGVDQVWLVPTFRHAFGKPLTTFEHRLAMCRLAMAPFAADRVRVSEVEAGLGGTSRTIDTVQHLLAAHPGLRIDLVVGADIFRESAAWKRFDDLRRLCGFIVLGRQGYPPPEDVATSPPLPDVSSTTIRDRVRRGEDVAALVPAPVAAYVAEHGLYR